VAFECARRGAQVRVLDPRPPGGGASQASAGILAPYIEGHGPGLRALGARGMAAYEPFLAALGEAVSTSPEYRRAGTLQAAFDDEGARELNELARLLAENGVEHRRLDGAAARALEPALSPRVIAALEIPEHGYVVPDALVAALVEAAIHHGASFAKAEVTAVVAAGRMARVETRTGDAIERIDGDAVVLAAGSWVAGVSGVAHHAKTPAVKPVRGQLLHLKACAPVSSRVLWGPRCYVVPWQDGTVLVGATVEDVGFDEHATVGGVRALVDAAAALVPGLDAAVFQEVRVGLRPATADELPIIGPSATMPQVFYACGHYRNGVLLAPLTAALVADLVLDGRAGVELAGLRPARFGL
jgi:glycine oxidase